MRYPDPLTAVAVSPEEYGGKGTRSAHRKLALASVDGTVRIRTRGKGRPRAGETGQLPNRIFLQHTLAHDDCQVV